MVLAPLYLAGAAAVCWVVSIAASQILMGLALAALIPTRQKLRWPPVTLPLALFAAGTLVSLAASGNMRAGLPQVKKFYVYLMLFLIVSAFRTVSQVRWLVLGWALAASLSAAWGLEQFVKKFESAERAHQNFYDAYIGARITGFMGHWMTFSGHMMMAVLLIGALVFFSADRRWIPGLLAAGVLVSVALIAAETRSMWLGAAAGGMYLLWFWRRWLVAAVPVLAATLLLINPAGVRERAISAFHPHGDVDSNEHRALTRAIGWRMIKAHPWLGIGPEQVSRQYLDYLPPGTRMPLPTGYYGHLHNIYVHYAAERGVPAMLALMWMLGRSFFDFVRALRRLPSHAEERWVLHGAVAVIVAVLISGFWELNLGDSEVLGMFLAVLGCGYVAIAQGEARCPGGQV